ncbi:MAG: hypothetical protein M1839_001866 [Geoglossum umbratile]|nr:MAG: hypothetical protein M1839_001866 [Geoglossum umbratile]
MTPQPPICADCVTGSIHEGTPAGRTGNLHGLPTYIAEPPDGTAPKGLVVILPDVFGWEFTNTRVLADVFLSLRAYSYIIPFVIRNRKSVVLRKITTFLRSVRDNEGKALRIGAAGFCFGGRYAVLMTHNDTETSTATGGPLVDAVFAGHPAQVSIPGDIEKVKLPLSIAIGSLDSWMSMKQVEETKKVLGTVGVEHEVVVYEGAKHGFAVRGTPGDEAEVKRGIQAEDQAVSWFTKFLVLS